jgi:glycosyltransferase involved in cell wall biosynthesis
MSTANDPGSQPLVSVVTPVYNAEPYLAECIESVLAQTYGNWDYTILNNCSTDRSLEIARSYAARDPRIRVENNGTFLGQTGNLNKAMSLISPDSKYVKMVLADDWMFPNCLWEMVRVAELHPTAGIVSSYRLDDRRVNCDGLPYPSTFVRGRDICRATLLGDIYVFGTPNTLLYRSVDARQRVPFFDQESLHEDTEVCYEILMHRDLGFVHQVLTFTRRQNESLAAARKVHDPQHLLDKLIVTLKYGPQFLDPQEYEACRRRIEGDYYDFLAARSLRGASSSFWEYHRDGLSPTRYRIRRSTLARHVAGAVLRQLFDPLGLARKLLRAVRRAVERYRGAGPTAGSPDRLQTTGSVPVDARKR